MTTVNNEPSIESDDVLAALRLRDTPGIGARSYLFLISQFGSAGRAIKMRDRWPPALNDAGRIPDIDYAEREVDKTSSFGARLLGYGTSEYPDLLSQIADPPPLLACLGDAGVLMRPAVAIIGARNASGNGCRFARKLAHDVANSGFVVVSGLARGIDTAAHQGALDAQAITVAVIASGLDVPYPEENRTLAEDISDAGVVLSERPMGAAPQARHFPRRNRIISGLTLGTVVVEAAPKSGSLITARLALEQNREVMAVPGSPLDARHRGTNKLLREGAHLVECAEDVVEIIGPLAEQRRTMEPRRALRNPRPQARQRRQSETPAKPCHSDASLENRILEVIGAEPLSVDELIRQCQADAAQVQQTLLELELVGTVERQPGNRVARASN